MASIDSDRRCAALAEVGPAGQRSITVTVDQPEAAAASDSDSESESARSADVTVTSQCQDSEPGEALTDTVL